PRAALSPMACTSTRGEPTSWNVRSRKVHSTTASAFEPNLAETIASRADLGERLARLGPFGDRGALVVGLLPSANAQRHLDATLLEIEIERHQGVPVAHDCALQRTNLLGV